MSPATLKRVDSGMERWRRLMAEPQTARIYDSNPRVRANIERAAKRIDDEVPVEQQAAAALAKAVRAIDGQLKIFLSYKQKHRQLAQQLVNVLNTFGAGKIDIEWDARNRVGEAWEDELADKIKDAHWFILFLPDANEDLDWTLFEAGIFRGAKAAVDRLLCLHHPDTSFPSQLRGLQNVAGTEAGVEMLLRQLFLQPDAVPGLDPVNGQIQPEMLHTLAVQIAGSITAPHVRQLVLPHVDIRFAAPLGDRPDVDGMLQATIERTDPRAAALFGRMEGDQTFGELCRELTDPHNRRWIGELAEELANFAGKRTVRVCKHTFVAVGQGRVFRCALHAAERIGQNQVASASLVFVEQFSAETTRAPKRLRVLLTAVRLTYRFRWDVLEALVFDPDPGVSAEQRLRQIRETIERIEGESLYEGLFEMERLLGAFDGDAAKEVEAMYVAWEKLRNSEGTGTLDKALERGDPKATTEALREIAPLNRRFMELAVPALGRMIEVMW